ncbi:MAG: M4 family metallopeptidase [Legionellaceae bacterium]|nr:M4 family metallopeptidase [Legionellaceae bacterium]
MDYRLSLTGVAIAVALSVSAATHAATPLAMPQQNFKDIKRKFALQLPGQRFMASQKSDQLQFVKQHIDKKNVAHIRLQQRFQGFPVFGGYTIAHSRQPQKTLMGAAPASVKMTGVLYENLASDLGSVPANFVANGASVLQKFVQKYQKEPISDAQVTPMIYIDEQHKAHWAYKVSVFVLHQDNIPSRPVAIMDAQHSKTFVQWNDVKTERVPVKGIGYGGNSKTGKIQYGTDFVALEITRDTEDNSCFLENSEVKVVDMEHRYSSAAHPMRFNCLLATDDERGIYWTGYQGDGYDEENGAFSPTNDALYAGYVIKHMYHDWYGEEVLTKKDGSPMQLVMRVHYGSGYENAYWDGRQMTFGDGENMMYPLVSLGVGGHEISHGFTEQHSDLNYYGQSGGMNEAFSDMAAMAAEYYSVGKASWQIGAEIMKEDSGYDALRYMDDPSRDGRSINSADEYYGGLDVHYSSGVYNHLFYILANKEGWDVRKAFDVMVKANMDYWRPFTDFDEGGCGVINATRDLGYGIEDVKASLSEVAINYLSCMDESA